MFSCHSSFIHYLVCFNFYSGEESLGFSVAVRRVEKHGQIKETYKEITEEKYPQGQSKIENG